MKFCNVCGKECEDSVKFCVGCGTKFDEIVEKKVVCPNCGKKFVDNSSFCDACGTKLEPQVNDGGPLLKKVEKTELSKPKILVKLTESADIIENVPEEERSKLLKAKRKHDGQKAIGTAKTILKTICNVFWILFYGLWAAIGAVCSGIAYCIGLITIPCGIVSFKSISLVFSPFKKRVVTHFGNKGFWNVIWLIFGGIVSFLVCKLLQLIFNITFIGRPIGNQLGKLASFYLAPFGCQILEDTEFSGSDIEKDIYTRQYIMRNQYDENFASAAEEIKKATKERLKSELIKKIVWSSILVVFIIVVGSICGIAGIAILVALVLAVLIASDYLLEFFTSKYIYEYGYGSRKELITYFDKKSRFQKRIQERNIAASYYPSIKNYVDSLIILETE